MDVLQRRYIHFVPNLNEHCNACDTLLHRVTHFCVCVCFRLEDGDGDGGRAMRKHGCVPKAT